MVSKYIVLFYMSHRNGLKVYSAVYMSHSNGLLETIAMRHKKQHYNNGARARTGSSIPLCI